MKSTFKPQFIVKNNSAAKKLVQAAVGAEIQKGHRQGAGNKHKYEVVM